MTDTSGAGHGGKNEFDAGAVGSGTTERKEVLAINRDLLKANPGWKDVSDYSGSTINQNLYNIVANTNRLGNSNERTLSHHMNAFNGKATGVEVWYYAGDSIGRSMAEKASAAISNALGLQNRGAKATTDLYVVSNTYPHCILVEWCFVDNPNDIKAFRANRTKAINAFAATLRMNGIGSTSSAPTQSGGVIYQNKSGWYEALRDDVLYLDANLTQPSGWKIKKGQTISVGKIVTVGGKYTRAAINLYGRDHFCTLRDDFWKKL